MGIITVSEFLETFPIPLHHSQPESPDKLWVFWSKYEGSHDNSSSTDPGSGMFCENIKYAFSNSFGKQGLICQFWEPVTIGGTRLLSASGKPFAVGNLCNHFAKYRQSSEKYEYVIDANENEIDLERDSKIIRGGPATAFVNRLPDIYSLKGSPLEDYASSNDMSISMMLPIRIPFESSCIGVVECTLIERWHNDYSFSYSYMKRALKEAGMDVFDVQEQIPYKTISGLKSTKNMIKEALKIVCGSHNLALAQVWIAYEDKDHVPFSSALEDRQTKRVLALKLTGYLDVSRAAYVDTWNYYHVCNIFPQVNHKELALQTLQDYKSRYMSNFCGDMLMDLVPKENESSAFTICLRCIETGDLDYGFEFKWYKQSNYVILLEALLSTLKRCLPSFKLASGAQIGEESYVIDVLISRDNFKIFHGKIASSTPKALEEGKNIAAVDCIVPSLVKCKTSAISLPLEVIEKQFGKTIKEAAKNLEVSLSTLKRKCKVHGISEWPGPNLVRRKASDSCNIQLNIIEDNVATQDPSTINKNKSIVSIKAEYADDMIKFHLPILQASFVTIQKEIGMKFKLSVGTYKIKYRDEDGDWILLASDEEMSYCIESSRKSDRIVVRLRVLPSPQPIIGTSGSCST